MAPIASTHPFRRTARRCTAGVLAVAALVPLAACGTGADDRSLDAGRAREMRAVLVAAVEDPATPLVGTSVAVADDELGTWAGAAGDADIRSHRPLTPGDRIRGGSIMKTFVATAVLQLVEEDRFGLDDRITAVLPASVTRRFPTADDITVRMLLNHTSGLAEYNDQAFEEAVGTDPGRVWTVDELLDLAAAGPGTGAPGERYAYANTNYNLLGLVLEEVTGQPWRTVVRERVIERLGLEHTTLPEPGRAVTGRLAHGYQAVGGDLVDLTRVDPSMAGAAGGHALLTTDTDLVRFVGTLLDGELFDDEATLGRMLTFVDGAEPTGKDGQGLGVERYRLPDGNVLVGHVGGAAGYLTVMGRVQGTGLDLAVTITTTGDPLPVLLPTLEVLQRA